MRTLGRRQTSQQRRIRRAGLIASAVVLLLAITIGRPMAGAGPGDPPIYNPASKSYFQLLESSGRWHEAEQQAQAQVFKGVRGRLAIIENEESHDFVMRHFDVSREMWIGLRYWCEFRMLEWVGLRPYSPTDPGRFQIWFAPWSRDDQGCLSNARGPDAYLGVYYRPLGDYTARWQAVRGGKGFGRLLVEFPTGAE